LIRRWKRFLTKFSVKGNPIFSRSGFRAQIAQKKSGLLFFSDAVCGLNSIRGTEILYPQPFGKVTAGADKDDPMDRRVQEYRRYHEGFGDILFQIN